jgi:hypothetical protein
MFLYILKKIFLKINLFVAKRNNYLNYKSKKISKFEFDLRNLFLSKNQQFGVFDFYQNYPPLKISGLRSTISRIAVYKLLQKIDTKMMALDIGGNISFFSIYLSKYLKQVDVVESNEDLTKIGKKLLQFEKIKNVNIYNVDFKNYASSKKYDLILSLAVHNWVGLNFKEYLYKLFKLMHKNSIVLLESHIIYNKKGDFLKEKILSTNLFKIIDFGIIDDHNGKIREFFYLKINKSD